MPARRERIRVRGTPGGHVSAGTRVATIRDIATAVGVSVATVSNVLNGRPNVGDSTRDRVLRAAKRLGYQPNRAAQAMRTGRTRTIGLVLPDLTNPFFPELAQAVENKARTLGLLVCLIDSQGSGERETDGIALLMQHAVDGFIWCPVGSSVSRIVPEPDRPIVLIDRPHSGYPVVHSDYRMGGRLLAQYVARMGHTRVGLLSGPSHLESARQRREGFVKGLPKRVGVEWEVNVGFDGELSKEAIAALRQPRGATVIVAGNDLTAISAMRHLTEHGVRVPEDISITGFDNIHWADVVTPRLTTIAQPLGAIGAKAVELMHARISGKDVPSRPTILDVTLIEGKSVRSLDGPSSGLA